MLTVNQMTKDIVRREGGYVNDPKDPGGPTNYGVSLRYAKDVVGYDLDLDNDGDVDRYDIMKLEPKHAEDLFKRDFYQKPRYDELPEVIQAQTFDIAVNAGAKRATILLQKAINDLGGGLRSIDGRVGPMTIAACKIVLDRKGSKALCNQLVKVRIDFYERLVRQNSKFKRFIKGWTNRSNEFLLKKDVPLQLEPTTGSC